MGQKLTQFIPGHTPWNKGRAVRLNPEGEFQRGSIPWNKGLRLSYSRVKVYKRGWKTENGWLCQWCKHIFWQQRKQKFCSHHCQFRQQASIAIRRIVTCKQC